VIRWKQLMRHVAGTLAAGFTGIAAFSALALISGCGSGGGSTSGSPTPAPTGLSTSGRLVDQPGWAINSKVGPTHQQAQKKWTFLVFMNGANDLEEFGSLNMNQMEQIGSTNDINLVVQFKRYANRYDTSNGNWGDTRRFYVTKDNNQFQVNSMLLSQRDNLDMGQAATLQNFVQWGLDTFPAERYCLVVWNHGAGWRSAKTNRVTRGVSYDDVTGSHIDTIDIPAAIDMGSGRKWDVLAFDSSLMQMLEVAYEVRNKATYIVGSEESPPGEGYPYDRFISNLAANPNMSPRDFAIDIVQQTINDYGVNSNTTQSVLDASKVADIVGPIDDLGAALLSVKGTYSSEIVFARDNAENYDYPTYHDILDFLRLLTEPLPGDIAPPVNNQPVLNAAQRVRTAVQAAIIKNVNGSLHPRSNGLSIFLPSPTQYKDIDIDQANGFGQRYGELSFTKAAPNWQSFLVNGPR
jgi:hypothetical protein